MSRPEIDEERRRSPPGGAGARRPRPIGARDLRGDARGIVERRERLAHGGGLVHPGRRQIGVVLGDVLRELVDDVGGPGGIERQGAEPRADEGFPVRHGGSGRRG